MRKRAVAATSLALSSAVLTLAACAAPITKGTVVDKQDTPAHTETVMLSMYRTQCTEEEVPIGNNRFTEEDVCRQVIAYWYPVANWIPEEWSLEVRDGKRTGWVDVTQDAYGKTVIGRYWRAEG